MLYRKTTLKAQIVKTDKKCYHTAMILDGKILKTAIAERLKATITTFETKPTLVIIQVGEKVESTTYINQKKLFGETIGAQVLHTQFPETVDQDTVVAEIERLNREQAVHGIIVQLPLPKHLNAEHIIDTILPHKDVDGLTALNTKKLMYGEKGIVPATTRGILTLLKHYNIALGGKKVVIIGRSNLVGKPTALALLKENATVTMCHRYTQNISEETKRADILIVAAGTPKLITENHVRPGQVVIDVGITAVEIRTETGELKKKLLGDVDFEAVSPIVEAITPVPGGVGAMTVASLFENLVEAV